MVALSTLFALPIMMWIELAYAIGINWLLAKKHFLGRVRLGILESTVRGIASVVFVDGVSSSAVPVQIALNQGRYILD